MVSLFAVHAFLGCLRHHPTTSKSRTHFPHKASQALWWKQALCFVSRRAEFTGSALPPASSLVSSAHAEGRPAERTTDFAPKLGGQSDQTSTELSGKRRVREAGRWDQLPRVSGRGCSCPPPPGCPTVSSHLDSDTCGEIIRN